MNTNGTGNDSFGAALRERAAAKQAEWQELVHERKRIDLRLGRCKAYINNLNLLLEAEQLPVIPLKEQARRGGVGTPGNRSPDMPLRRAEWGEMTIEEIIAAALDETTEKIHANGIVERIYEIEDDKQRHRAKHNIRSTLRGGAKKGLWDVVGRAWYKGKAKQGLLVSA